MKKILVTQRLLENESYPEVREALDIRWGTFLYRCGVMPIPVAADFPAAEYFRICEPSGILLTGGNDLAVCQPENKMSQKRDALETELIRMAVEKDIPVIGVCRGMQMLAHYFGISLHSLKGHVAALHQIEVIPETLLSQFFSEEETVNSYHQFGLQSAGKFLRPAAVAADNTIEAFEHKSKPVYGMMWHPERRDPFSPSDVAFFRKVFINE